MEEQNLRSIAQDPSGLGNTSTTGTSTDGGTDTTNTTNTDATNTSTSTTDTGNGNQATNNSDNSNNNTAITSSQNNVAVEDAGNCAYCKAKMILSLVIDGALVLLFVAGAIALLKGKGNGGAKS